MTDLAPYYCVYIGSLENMIAEVGAFDPRRCAIPQAQCGFTVMLGCDQDVDTEWFATHSEAREYAADLAAYYDIPVHYI